jgi:hypothetical protein
MDQPETADTIARAGLRRHATSIAAGVAGVSTLALLAAGSLTPLLAGGLTPASVGAWLGGLGANALASWLDQWARGAAAQALRPGRDAEQSRIEQCARDLQGQLAANDLLAADVAVLLELVRAIPTAVDALAGQGEQQIRLLRLLLADAQAAMVHNQRLRDVTLRALLEQGDALREVIERRDPALLAELRALRAGDHIQGDQVGGAKITVGGISIGGSVGALQQVTITGGMVQGPIIGSQMNTSAPAPTNTEQRIPAATPEEIDEQRELLEAHRRTLGIYLKRLAKLGSANAAPEVFHGIREAREGIGRCKAALRGWGVAVGDLPYYQASGKLWFTSIILGGVL